MIPVSFSSIALSIYILSQMLGSIARVRADPLKENHRKIGPNAQVVPNFYEDHGRLFCYPFYACTCHKTQGLTLPRAVVRCSKEFVPGLIFVAISWVWHPDDIQVCRFKCDQLLKPSDEALRVCENSQAECSDLSCCVNRDLTSDFFKVYDLGAEFGEGDNNNNNNRIFIQDNPSV